MSQDARQKARIFFHRGDLRQALRWYREAEIVDLANADDLGLAETLGNLGNVLAMTGATDEAESCYRELLPLQRRRGDLVAVAQTLVNLGNLQKDADRLTPARAYYLEALALAQEARDFRTLGILHSNLGLLDAAEGQGEPAVAEFRQALDYHRRVGDEEGLAVPYSQLGKTFLDLGRLVDAERCLSNASEHSSSWGTNRAKRRCFASGPKPTSGGRTCCRPFDAWSGSSRSELDIGCQVRSGIGAGSRSWLPLSRLAREETLPSPPTS